MGAEETEAAFLDSPTADNSCVRMYDSCVYIYTYTYISLSRKVIAIDGMPLQHCACHPQYTCEIKQVRHYC
jgi:hypothetical protein